MGDNGDSVDTSTSYETIDTGTPGLFYTVGNDGTVYDPLGNVITDFSTLPTSITSQINSALSDLNPTTPTSTPSTTATPSPTTQLGQLLNSLAQGAQSGLKIFQQAQGPSLVAGTNVLYNPATGQYYNPTTGQVVNPLTGSLGPSVFGTIDPSMLLIGGLLLGGVLLISMVGHR